MQHTCLNPAGFMDAIHSDTLKAFADKFLEHTSSIPDFVGIRFCPEWYHLTLNLSPQFVSSDSDAKGTPVFVNIPR